MYVDSLTLSDFRAIARADVEFTHPLSPRAGDLELPNINLLIGTNGGGKSTVLKGIASAVLSPVIDLEEMTGGSIVNWPRIGGTGPSEARVTYRREVSSLTPNTADAMTVHVGSMIIEDGSYTSRSELSPGDTTPLKLFGYGPQRFTAGPADQDGRDEQSERVANLFELSQFLRPPEPWLPEVSGESLAAINLLMPPDTSLTGRLRDGQIEVTSRGLTVTRGMLSDGAQSYMAWVLDLISRLRESCDDAETYVDVTGTVLVDEIDQRMHPRWQQIVLKRLAEGLPRLQFICSAHSPLLAGGLRPGNLTVLNPDFDAPGEGAMTASHYEEDIYGHTTDRVLTSSYFSLASSRSELFQEDLRLLAAEAADSDDKAVEFIKTLAGTADAGRGGRTPTRDRPDRLRRRR